MEFLEALFRRLLGGEGTSREESRGQESGQPAHLDAFFMGI